MEARWRGRKASGRRKESKKDSTKVSSDLCSYQCLLLQYLSVIQRYLSDVRADSLGIQQSYVNRNVELAEAARIRKEFEAQEQIQANELIKQAKTWCRAAATTYKDLYDAISAFCSTNGSICQKASINDGYDVLTSTLDKIIAEKEEIYFSNNTIKSKYKFLTRHSKSCRNSYILNRYVGVLENVPINKDNIP